MSSHSAPASAPVFACQANLAAFGPVEVQLYEKQEGHVRLVLVDALHPTEIVVSDATDGSLLHSYERRSETCHLFGAALYSGKRQMLDVSLTFGSEADADKFARGVFSRYTGGADESRSWMYPTKCGILQKASGCVDRHQNRWFLFQRNCWLSYWRSPRDQLPLGVIDWRSVLRVGIPANVLDKSGDFEIEVQRGTSGARVHFLRAKTSEAAAQWIHVLTERPLKDIPSTVVQAVAAVDAPVVQAAEASAAAKGQWRPVCGVPLETLLAIDERQGSVPTVVAAIVNMLAADAAVCTSGLFDGTGSPGFVFAAKATLEAGQDPSAVWDNAPDKQNVGGSLLLKFLYEMPDPVCTETRALAFLSAVEAPCPVQGLKEIVADLPECHRTLLQYLIAFLKLLSQHSDENGLTPDRLGSALGPAMFRELCVLPSCSSSAAATAVVTTLMDQSDKVWSGQPPLLQMPAFKNLTWKLLLVGRLLRVTPDDVERKLIALEEMQTLEQALSAAEKAGADSQATTIRNKREKLRAEFYYMETKCAPGNVALDQDRLSAGLLYGLRDHLELLKQEEINLRAAFRSAAQDKDRPSVDLKDLKGTIDACARSLALGDFVQDSQDMFSELFYLRGEKKRAFSLPEFLDVLGKWMELYGLFRKHDKFKQGFISVNNMVESMEEFGALFGYKPTPFHVMQLCNEFDVDASFGVTWEEFRLVMHRWIEEKKKGEDIGKGAHRVVHMVTQDVLEPVIVDELKCLFSKFAKPNGTFDVLELGSLFEEICYSFNLGGTLSELFRVLRAVETASQIEWPQFVSIMGKWIILKQLFQNYSKDGGATVRADDLEYPLRDLRDMWGCFDPRHGNNDLSVMAREVAASVNTPSLTFEEFVNALRFQVAFKVIFELYDPESTGVLPYESVLQALRTVEDYCGLDATFGRGLANLDQHCMDAEVALTWPEFLVVSHVAVGDEFDGSY